MANIVLRRARVNDLPLTLLFRCELNAAACMRACMHVRIVRRHQISDFGSALNAQRREIQSNPGSRKFSHRCESGREPGGWGEGRGRGERDGASSPNVPVKRSADEKVNDGQRSSNRERRTHWCPVARTRLYQEEPRLYGKVFNLERYSRGTERQVPEESEEPGNFFFIDTWCRFERFKSEIASHDSKQATA